MTMRKAVELPLIEPIYSTYHYMGACTAVTGTNETIRNWYLNQIMDLTCNRKFLAGFTTPEISIPYSSWMENPYLDRKWVTMQFTENYINPIIRNMIDDGYYVAFNGVDDYYVKNKSRYKEMHFSHDGLICGYNQEDKTYCIYSYDSKWIYRKYWTPQKSFNAGRVAMMKQGVFGDICALKPKAEIIDFDPKQVYEKLKQYLDSDVDKYPFEGEGNVFGIVVHEYIAEYVSRLHKGDILYERMDNRVFRMIWEHKKAMLERILLAEQTLGLNSYVSENYKSLVAEANTMRMLYAAHHMKRRDSVLPIIKTKLLTLMKKERELLTTLLEKMGKAFEKDGKLEPVSFQRQ